IGLNELLAVSFLARILSDIVLPPLTPSHAQLDNCRGFIGKNTEETYQVFNPELISPLVPHEIGKNKHSVKGGTFRPCLHPVVVNELIADIHDAKFRLLWTLHVESVFREARTGKSEGLAPDLLVSD